MMMGLARSWFILVSATAVLGQANLQTVLQCANPQAGVCRLQCQPGELSVFPLNCSYYSAIFGATYRRCVTSMPCCYWGARCQTSCGANQRQVGPGATCTSAAQVCCINSSLVPTPAPPIATTATPSSVASRQGTCGRLNGRVGYSAFVPLQVQPRIIGGSVAGALDWPWMVRITYTTTNNGFCAGVLVDDDTVVTVAHCVQGVASTSIRVTLGDYNPAIADPGQETVGLASQAVIRTFRRGVRGSDFAVLKLAGKITFTNRKLPACLPDITAIPLVSPRQCYVAGWGVSETGLGGPLRAMNVQLLDRTTCQRQTTPLPQDMLCTANPAVSPSDGCLYDDGDMLVCLDVRGRWSLIGLMSEYTCGRGLPVLFTDVRAYTDLTLNLL
ncbi:chymotrypsin-like elastase family member 2A [Babylonia areolata]|uniref:chymotrypsin-like elastase family member 2A n=1 Tax=Babylonia areolata TaxID=304850 RepID=UPI003FD33B37